MKKTAFAAVIITTLMGLLISGCATSAPDTSEHKYSSPAGGLSMWYPEGWMYEEQEDAVTFASSEELLGGDEMTSGAGMMVGWIDWEEPWELDGSLAEFLVWNAILQSPLSQGKPEDLHEEARTIGGQDAFMVTFEGTFEEDGVPTRGFVAGTEYERRGYLFWAASALVEWPEHGPDLEGMLESVQFTTPTVMRTPTPQPVGESAGEITEMARWRAAGSVHSVAFAPDGETLASGWARDGIVRLWRVKDGQLLQTLNAHTRAVDSVAFSPDGLIVASGCSDSTVRLWRVSDGELLQTLDVDPGGVFVASCVALSPDWQTLASGSSGGPVQLWRMSDGELLQTLSGHMGTVTSVAFSPNGETLASASSSGGVQLCRVSDGQLLHSLLFRGLGGARVVAFSPNGQTLASGQRNGTVHLWSVSDGQLLQTLEGHTGAVYAVAFSPDGEILASGSTDNTVRLWRVSDGALWQMLEGHTDFVSSVAFSPDGEILASGSADGTIRLWGIPAE